MNVENVSDYRLLYTLCNCVLYVHHKYYIFINLYYMHKAVDTSGYSIKNRHKIK